MYPFSIYLVYRFIKSLSFRLGALQKDQIFLLTKDDFTKCMRYKKLMQNYMKFLLIFIHKNFSVTI